MADKSIYLKARIATDRLDVCDKIFAKFESFNVIQTLFNSY